MDKNQKDTKTAEKPIEKVNDLEAFFIDSLKDIYWAENALVKSLPKMFDKATDQKLKTAIKNHLEQTKEQVNRLDQVFESLGIKAEGKKCHALEGLLKEGDQIMLETEEGAVRDIGLIAASQKIEHYEIATYGTLAAFAKTLNKRPALDLLLKTLGEEKKADCLLTTIADTYLNAQAASEEYQSKKITAV